VSFDQWVLAFHVLSAFAYVAGVVLLFGHILGAMILVGGWLT
jgi:hypothetical protein